MRARSIGAAVAIGYLAACGTNDGLVGQQPPLVQSLAIGEQGDGRFRLAAAVTAPDSGVLRMQWDATAGSITVDNTLETEWTLPPKAGAYPIRLSVEDALGGVGQALVVILHDPGGRAEITPVTLASFKLGQLISTQTQHAAFRRGVGAGAQPVATPPGGVMLAQMSLAQTTAGIELNGTVQGAGNTPVTATWSAIDGAFEQAQGLRARWRPQQKSGLGAISLTVSDGANNQGQGVVRLLMEQGLPRENRIDFVTVRNGALGRQAFGSAPTPVGQLQASPAPLPVPASAVVASPSPAVASPSPSPSGSPGNPYPNYSPTPTPSPSPSKSPSPSPSPSAIPSPSPSPTPSPSPSS